MLIVSVCDWPAQSVTGPVGVTVGTTGSGFTVTATLLLAADVPQEFVAVTVFVLVVLMTLVVPVPPPLQANVQPVQGLLIVSVCVCPAQSVTGPAGVTVGTTGNGFTVTETLLLVAEVPQLLVAVTVVELVALMTFVVPVPPPLQA